MAVLLICVAFSVDVTNKVKKANSLELGKMKVKHRFCPLCRQWYPQGYGFVRHKCCKKYLALKLVFGWDFVKQLKGDEFVEESRRIMLATQEKNSFKEITR